MIYFISHKYSILVLQGHKKIILKNLKVENLPLESVEKNLFLKFKHHDLAIGGVLILKI